jgi:zinc/manganese transport system permease protein
MPAIGLLHWLLRQRLTGAGTLVWEFVFYATFGVIVTSSVAIAGVLLVFSFLIIPAAIGVMFASSLGRQLAIGWIAGTVTSAAGLAASFVFDLPTGAAMVCTFGASLGPRRDALPASAREPPETRCVARSARALGCGRNAGGVGGVAGGWRPVPTSR